MTVPRLPFSRARRGVDIRIVVLAILVVFSQLVYFLATKGKPPVTFIDADCYMRLVRVQHWAMGGSWYDTIIPESNAPYGESLHWSRPLDILILPGALLLKPLLGFRNALFLSGIFISPLLEVGAIFALAWGMVPFHNRAQRIQLLLFFATQPGVFLPFMGGRPDHHSLLELLFVIEIALLLRIYASPRNLYARLLGLTMALALWVSIEGIVSIAMALLILGSTWVYEKSSRFASATATTFLWLFLGSLLALLLDRPPTAHFFVFAADRISFQHVALMGFFAIGTSIMKWTSWKSIDVPLGWPRLALGGGIGLFTILLVYLFIPALFSSPYSQSNKKALELWLPLVAEIQPIARFSFRSAYLFMLILGALPLCLPWLCMRLASPKNRGRFLCLLTAAGLVLYLPLTLYQMRWGCYSGLLLIFPLNAILTQILTAIQIRYAGVTRLLFRVLVTSLLLTGFLLLTALVNTLQPCPAAPAPTCSQPTSSTTSEKKNDVEFQGQLATLCQWLQQIRYRLPENPRFLNFIDDGPEILYRTGWEIIATPYHRNGQAIFDTYTILTSPPNDATAMALLQQRRPNLILIRITGAEMKNFYYGKNESLYHELAESTPPTWAEQIPLPESLSEHFRLYRLQLP